MKEKFIATAALAACAGLAGTAFAYQTKPGDEPETNQPAVPFARQKSADAKKENAFQNTTGRGMKIDPEAYARFQKAIKPSDDAFRLARTRFHAGDLTGAEKAARQAIPLAANLSPATQANARSLIGKIRLKQGKYQEALEWIGADWQPGADSSLNLDVALCYVRLGNTTMAKQFYSDQDFLEYNSQATVQDLPGTRNRKMLEASILMARGSNALLTGRYADALSEFNAALKIVPTNGIAAYYAGRSLLFLGRRAEAGPYFVKAAQNGHGKIAQEAKRWADPYLNNEAKKKAAAEAEALPVPSGTAQTPRTP